MKNYILAVQKGLTTPTLLNEILKFHSHPLLD